MKAELIACFQDTLAVSENKLRDNTLFSANSNKVYKEKYEANRQHKDTTACIRHGDASIVDRCKSCGNAI